MPLNYKVFQHSPAGFSGTSTLVYGERDAVLIDATFLLSDAHKLAAGLIEFGKNITHIYISYFHPDHHFGAEVLHQAFPEARVVALPSVVRDILYSSNDKTNLWGPLFGKNVPDLVFFPRPLFEGRLEVEGEVIEFSDDWDGDCANNTMIWIPSLRVACGTDVVNNDAHLWMGEGDAARRNKWRASLRKLQAMNPRAVVPGHCDPAKLNLQDCSAIDFTLKYIDVYEGIIAQVKTGDEFVDAIDNAYPGMWPIRYMVDWQARLLFPNSCSDRIGPVPGPFVDPSGNVSGEAARA